MDFRVLGWISVALAVIASSPYWLKALNKWTFKTKDKRFLNLIKRLRPIHKAAGILLAAIALVHGWMALGGRIGLHTGFLAYLGFLLTIILGISFYSAKDRRAFKGHKVMALIGFLLIMLHLIRPWALGEWFGVW